MRRFRLSPVLAGLLLAGLSPALSGASPSIAQTDPSDRPLWLRYPAISPDGQSIAFVYGGQIWRVPAGGGEALPLTSALFYATQPVWSPDSSKIAFASMRHGNADVFVMPARGGDIQRLTFHSSNDTPYAFSPDGASVYFGSVRLGDAREAFGGYSLGGAGQLYSVPVGGGRERLVIPLQALDVAPSPDGRTLLYTNRPSQENEWRKHAVSEAARDIWAFDTKDATHRQITTFRGEDRDALWSADGKSIYYLSEQSGSFNVWRRPFTGAGEPVQVTFHQHHPVRFLSRTNQDDLVYGYDGEIWKLAKGAKEPVRVEVRIAQGTMLAGSFYAKVNDAATEIASSPDGSQLAVVARGEIFVVETASGKTRRVTTTPQHERDVSFSPDGRSLLYVSERGGKWDAFETTMAIPDAPSLLAPGPLKETAVTNTATDVLQPAYSPDGQRIAFLEDRKRLVILDRHTGKTTTVLPDGLLFSYTDNDLPFTWSPDGRWLAVTTGSAASQFEVYLVDASGQKAPVNISRSGFQEMAPTFSPDGKTIYYLSTRAGLRTTDAKDAEVDIYATFLTQDAYDAFVRPADQTVHAAATTAKDATPPTAAPAWEPQFDGLEFRTGRITPFSSNINMFKIAADGKSLLWVSTSATTGMTGYRIKLGAPGMSQVFAKPPSPVSSYATDAKGETLFLIGAGGIERIKLTDGSAATVPFTAEMAYDQRGEMAYLFEHVGRLTQQKFYRADMQGVDWAFYRQAYAKFLPHIIHWEDFAEMLSEMAGELNASHMGSAFHQPVSYGDATASLGVYYDHAFTGPGMRIVDVLKQGPAGRADSQLRPGATILAVDGAPITPDSDIYPLLNHKASTPVRLTIQPAGGGNPVEEVVTPTPFENDLIAAQARWVERARETTRRLSNGRLGYVHVPLMNTTSYQTFYSELFGSEFAAKEGVVVDVRFNGGGNLANQLIADLSASAAGSSIDRDGRFITHIPENRWSKPSILLANGYSYSDGSIFPHLYTQARLGAFVGEPVPGTGTSVWWVPMIGGKLKYGIPEIGRKDLQGHWFENTEDQPDILVRRTPDSIEEGRDLQLERAVQQLLGQLGESK